MKRHAGSLALALLLAACGKSVPAPESIDHGRFKNVQLYRPAKAVQSVVLLLSGKGGWDAHMARQAEALRREQALVVGIDNRQLMAALAADGGDCVFAGGDLENLSRFVQAYARLPGYRSPVLAGHADGATLAYATLAQSAPGLFAAGIVSSFCPLLAMKKPLCAGEGLHSRTDATGTTVLPQSKLPVPLLALHGAQDQRCAAAVSRALISQSADARQSLLPDTGAGYDSPQTLAALRAALRDLPAAHAVAVPAAPGTLGDLPVVEAPTSGNNPYLAIFWSGDGGWAGIDKEVASALNAEGVAVVGVDSLRYFWTARTPEGIAADIGRISRHYLPAWHRQQLILIGYSQGANVLPFAANRLDPALKKQVALVAAVGLSDHAVFEFHLGNWLADNNNGPATLPEVARMQALPFLCIHGTDESDSICPQLVGSAAKVVTLPGGHHYDGDYRRLAAEILAALPKQP